MKLNSIHICFSNWCFYLRSDMHHHPNISINFHPRFAVLHSDNIFTKIWPSYGNFPNKSSAAINDLIDLCGDYVNYVTGSLALYVVFCTSLVHCFARFIWSFLHCLTFDIWLLITPFGIFKIFFFFFLTTRYSLFNNPCYNLSSKSKLLWSYPVKPSLIIQGIINVYKQYFTTHISYTFS